ncbi:MAG: AMP-binding protein [Spirochaetales bacterium]|nr:AMP-binding protein [Spirochaetales bacterium]
MIPEKKISEYKNLVEVLCDKSHSEKKIVFIESDGDIHITYKQMLDKARKVLGGLQAAGLQKNHELILLLPNNFDFILVFWACLLGGIIPVPITFPEYEKNIYKIVNIWKTLNDPSLIIAGNNLPRILDYTEKAGFNQLSMQIADKSLKVEHINDYTQDGIIQIPKESDIAFIQFSSGSTSTPKGVILTHRNLLTNTRAILNTSGTIKTRGCYLGWMPLTHDMGLIGFHLVPVVGDCNNYLMPPFLFVRNPMFWLKKIAEYKPKYASSPNFGYKHIMKFFKPEKCADIDLSFIQLFYNGAEPISADVCRTFIENLKPFGLPQTAMYPVYGLAEATVAVAFPDPGTEYVEVYIDRNFLNIGDKIREIESTDDDAVCLVETGKPICDCFVRICDENGNEAGERIIGNIEIKGNNVTSGYYNNPEATANAINTDGWLKTGDIGFLRDGYLTIIGRKKDIIFVNGNTYHAYDIEVICNELEIINKKGIAVCGVYNPVLQTEEIICFLRFRGDLSLFSQIALTIAKHIIKRIGVGVSHIIPVTQFPVTTSGKLQRYKLKEAYLNGEFNSFINEFSLTEHVR